MPVGGCQSGRDIVANRNFALGEQGGHAFRERDRAGAIHVMHAQFLRPRLQHGIADSGARAAGADEHGTSWIHVRHLTPEALGKSPPVRVVTDAAAAAKQHGVYRMQSLGFGRELMQ